MQNNISYYSQYIHKGIINVARHAKEISKEMIRNVHNTSLVIWYHLHIIVFDYYIIFQINYLFL